MKLSAGYIANYLNGEVDGDSNVEVFNISKIEEGKAGTLSFLSNSQYTKYIYETKASIVIVNKDFVPEKSITSTLIRVDNAYEAFASLLDLYNQQKGIKLGIEEFAFVNDSAKIGEKVYIGAYAYIGKNAQIGENVKIYPHAFVGDNAVIGNNTILHSGVIVYQDCNVGNNCIIHSGSIIGADGFGFAPQTNNNYKKIPQVGNVIIEDYVEIGSNTSVDRATIGSTILRKGVKLDNLIQIAHNVEIGENTVIAAQAGVSGSTKIGKNCMIGGQVGIIGHITIGDNVKIAAQSGIGSSLKDNEIVQGTPSMPIRDYQKAYVLFRKLPELYQQIGHLQKEISALKK